MTMKKKGFTLIELLIVIAIIGILAVAFLPSLLGAPAKGRDAQRLATVQKVQNFIVSKMLAGGMPAGAVTGCIIDAAPAALPANDLIGQFIKRNIADFGGVFPKDPKSDSATTDAVAAPCTGQYGFVKYDAGLSYTYGVYAAVEIKENANIKCEDIDANANPTLAPGAIAAPAVGKVNCYLAVIQ